MNLLTRSSTRLTPTLRHLLCPDPSSSFAAAAACRSFSFFTQIGNPPRPSPSQTPAFSFYFHQSLFSARFFSQKAGSEWLLKENSSQPIGGCDVARLEEDEKDKRKATAGNVLDLGNKLRWGFIRKVYGTVTTQLVATAGVSAVMMTNPSVTNAVFSIPYAPWVLCGASLASLVPILFFERKYPLNVISLGAFTLFSSLSVGGCCAVAGSVVLQALGLTTAAVGSLTAYTFWAASKGKDFTFLGPMLFPCLVTLVATGLFQVFFPLQSSAAVLAYSGIGAIIFSAYIVYDTYSLLDRFKYDEHLSASVSLYLDVINLFLHLIRILSVLNRRD